MLELERPGGQNLEKLGKIIIRKGHIVEPVEHARQGVENNLNTSTFPNILEDRVIYSNR